MIMPTWYGPAPGSPARAARTGRSTPHPIELQRGRVRALRTGVNGGRSVDDLRRADAVPSWAGPAARGPGQVGDDGSGPPTRPPSGSPCRTAAPSSASTTPTSSTQTPYTAWPVRCVASRSGRRRIRWATQPDNRRETPAQVVGALVPLLVLDRAISYEICADSQHLNDVPPTRAPGQRDAPNLTSARCTALPRMAQVTHIGALVSSFRTPRAYVRHEHFLAKARSDQNSE